MSMELLDKSGLAYFWTKIKAYVAGLLSSKADDSDVVHKAGDENVTGTKTFVGSKKVAFKQSANNDKLGFTLFNNSNVEKGYLEYNPTNQISGVPLMTLGNYATAAAGLAYVGFRKYSSISGANGAYNLLTPLISDAKAPFNLTTTYTNFFLPLGVTDGVTTFTTAKSGLLDLSSFNAAMAAKLGTATVGATDKPVYLDAGTATAVNSALRTCYGGVESEAVSNTYFKIGSGSIIGTYNHLKARILVQHLTDGNSCIWDVWLCSGSTAGVYSNGRSALLDSTGYYGTNLIVAYKSNSGGSLDFELYVKETARYSNHRFTIIQECWRNNQKVGNILTLYNQLTTTGTSNITSGYTALTTVTGTVSMNINGSSTSCSGNAATATTLQTARKINGVSFDGSADVTLTAVVSSASRSADIAANGTFTVPCYVVGKSQLLVYLDGCLSRQGDGWDEVGTAGDASTTIKFNQLVPMDMEIVVRVN